MRFHVKCFWIAYALLFLAFGLKADPLAIKPRFSFHVMSGDAGGWPELLSSIGLTQGSGLGAAPGPRGYERFPYLPQALLDLGLEPPFRSSRLWAFFDSAYRTRVDVDYFAQRWRAAGISALQVAGWHFWERDAQGDEYLRH